MRSSDEGFALRDLVAAASGQLEVLAESSQSETQPVSATRLILSADQLSTARAADDVDGGGALTLWILPPDAIDADLARAALAQLPAGPAVLWKTKGLTLPTLRKAARDRVVLIAAPGLTPESVLTLTGQSSEQTLTRRLTSMQRALTQALATDDPLTDLVDRLARVCNAAVALVDPRGSVAHATGPLPLTGILDELDRAAGHERLLRLDSWNAVAVPVASPEPDRHGWLIAASRRPTFPDQHSVAAVHIASSLAETSGQVDQLARRQEDAITSALLEQVLALRPERNDPELGGRMASLGISFDAEVRAFLVRLPQGVSRTERGEATERFRAAVRSLLSVHDVPHLLSLREGGLIGIVQAPVHQLRRWLTEVGPPGLVVGIGRDAKDLGSVVDSSHDAQLALRALARGADARNVMVFEDFDFATRLFSDVGLEKMAAWADDLLAPIREQQILMDGLRRYFEHDLNTIGAAKALNVHHNSLRYRLAKVEELLGLSLRDPAMISSLYLALTALDVSSDSVTPQPTTRARPSKRGGTAGLSSPGNAVNSATHRPVRGLPGVAMGPNR